MVGRYPLGQPSSSGTGTTTCDALGSKNHAVRGVMTDEHLLDHRAPPLLHLCRPGPQSYHVQLDSKPAVSLKFRHERVPIDPGPGPGQYSDKDFIRSIYLPSSATKKVREPKSEGDDVCQVKPGGWKGRAPVISTAARF